MTITSLAWFLTLIDTLHNNTLPILIYMEVIVMVHVMKKYQGFYCLVMQIAKHSTNFLKLVSLLNAYHAG